MNTTANLLNDFFSKKAEGYDAKTKLVTNLGGFKLWWENGWKKMQRIFLAKPLFDAVKDLPVSMYVMSRARIGENGRAVVLPNGNGVQRDSLGLMFYTQFNMTDAAAKQFVKKIVQDIPMLEGYLVAGTDILKDAPNVANVSQVTFRDQLGNDVPLRLEGCIFLVASSGSEQSSQLWGFRNKATTKAAVAASNVANASEVDLTNLGI